MKKVIVVGGDGFCGWASALRLANYGHEVLIVDNLSRRSIDDEMSANSIVPIAPIKERIAVANRFFSNISFENIDVAKDYHYFVQILKKFNPDTIIHFGEQRAAPYSMLGEKQRRYTVDNNITATNNICSAVVDVNTNIHIIHLGTMGVYGYNDNYGEIPEGYLPVTINQTGHKDEIIYPPNPGSIYHLTKTMDHQLLQFYAKNWGIKITDLHQGIVWGAETTETRLHESLSNRFDYDGIYGTVLNRFIMQSINGLPLSVYGTGGQTRAFIHISDTAECIKIATENPSTEQRVRVLNQISESLNVKQIAELITKLFGGKIEYLENPRKELSTNNLRVSNAGFLSLGFEPILLEKNLIDDVANLLSKYKGNYNTSLVNNSPTW